MRLLKITILLFVGFCVYSAAKYVPEKYQCLPCGQQCDEAVYSEPGKCTHCDMRLVKASSIFFKSISPEKLCAYLAAHPNTVSIDVRTKEEFEGNASPDFGTLRNAVNIPIQDFDERMSEIEQYKKREILVFCSHSHRSPQVAYKLTQNGYSNVINLAGGMSELADASCKR